MNARILALTAGLFATTPALAGTVTMVLDDSGAPIQNVDDPAGRFQYSGGNIFWNGNDIGDFWMVKRVIFGASSANEGTVEITLSFSSRVPGNGNVVLKGTHSFNTGRQLGGVASVTDTFTALTNGTWTFDTSTDQLVIDF